MWRQAAFLAVAVVLQSLVFLVITESVDRHRPEVHRLDASPPTSSYTSGHTGAATALYGGLAVLALSRLRGPWRRIVGALLLLVPVLVAVARLYRGMHHPTDVVGGLVNGTLSLLIVGRALFTDGTVTAPAGTSPTASFASAGTLPGAPGPGRTAVIFNPTVTGEADREALRGSWKDTVTAHRCSSRPRRRIRARVRRPARSGTAHGWSWSAVATEPCGRPRTPWPTAAYRWP